MLAAEGFAGLVRTTVIMSNQELSHCGRRTCGGHCACVRERANACGCAGGAGVRACAGENVIIHHSPRNFFEQWAGTTPQTPRNGPLRRFLPKSMPR